MLCVSSIYDAQYRNFSISLLTAADDLSVSVASVPVGPDINAAEFFSLTCQATGGTGVYTYQWSSNCTGNCFLNNINPITQTITRDALRSTDSGLYTCTVTDNAGNNGSDFTQAQVIGKLTGGAYHAPIAYDISGVKCFGPVLIALKLFHFRI